MAADRRIRVGSVQPAAVQDHELHQLRQLREAMPGRQAGDVVFADEKKKFGVWFALAKRLRGIDRVGWRRAFQFERIDGEVRVAFDRGAQHLQANGGRRRLLLQLVGRKRGRNENQARELQRFDRFAGQDQVPMVNRIESAAEDADLLYCHSERSAAESKNLLLCLLSLRVSSLALAKARDPSTSSG